MPKQINHLTPRDIARFEAKFVKAEGCWNWAGACNNLGYGEFHLRGTNYCAHRVAYTLYTGIIPDLLCVLHTCDNPKCVNPNHLFLGTNGDNTRDMEK